MPRYTILSTAAFERAARKLIKKVPHIEESLQSALLILEADPFNLTKRHQIKKLHGVPESEGQWRLRIGVYRLRYDVEAKTVVLRTVTHRSEAY